LARSLVENELRGTDSRSICYFFFKDNEQQDRLAIAFCALLHQLFTAQPQLLKHAISAWQRNGEKLRNEVGELWRILINAATDKDSRDVICVLDALDECRERDRETLLRFLSELYIDSLSQTSRKGSLKFLVTSRPYDNIESDFQKHIHSNLPTIHLSGEKENDNIHKEIDLVIRERVAELAHDNQLSHLTAQTLELWLIRMENRTYLWLHLAIKAIEEKYKNSISPDSESMESLQLPSSIDDAYEKILSNVKNQEKVKKILHIIVGARRPLSLSEMAMALGLSDQQPTPQSYVEVKTDKKLLEKRLPHLCGLFVFINHSRIYLIHQTAKEFLIQKEVQADNNCWKHCLKFNDSQTIMAKVCIDYLSLYELDSDELRKAQRMNKIRGLEGETDIPKLEVLALLKYSSEHWPSHFRDSCIGIGSSALTKVYDLYQSKNNCFQWWFPLLWRAQYSYEDPPHMSDIRLAAFNNHDVVLLHLLSKEGADLEDRDNEGRTALIWGAELGHEKVTKLLLDKQANVNAQGGRYGNALQAASYKGHKAIVRLLLDHQAEISAQGGKFGNALQAASHGGHEAIVKLLLDKQANVNAQVGIDLYDQDKSDAKAIWEDFRTGKVVASELLSYRQVHTNLQKTLCRNALEAASYEGHETIVRLLLDNQADVNAQGGELGNALQTASRAGHEMIVRLLLDHHADVNAQGGELGNALQAASYGRHEAIVRLLIEHQADVNAQGGKYGNALQAAIYRGHEGIVKLLLDKHADVNAQGGEYRNALQTALYEGQEAIVKLLLDKHADVNAQGGEYRNALQIASHKGHEAITKLLLDKQANVNAQGGRYGNALQAASYKGHEMIVRLLMENQADVNAQGGEFGNALQAASHAGNEAIVKLLIEGGADIQAISFNGWTPLYSAAKNGYINIVELLIEKGVGFKSADSNGWTTLYSEDSHGWTALHSAADGGHIDIIEQLIKGGADVRSSDHHGWTPLHSAAGRGHMDIVELLIKEGAYVEISDCYGRTPLRVAAGNGRGAVVKRLMQDEADCTIRDFERF
jgi:ankyrin repeat protein